MHDLGITIRVSTDGQTLDAQQSALSAAGAERVFAEKVSGAVTDRKALARAIAALGAGDVLPVTRLDRLARSTRDLLNVLDAINKAQAGFRSLWMGRRHPPTLTPSDSTALEGPETLDEASANLPHPRTLWKTPAVFTE